MSLQGSLSPSEKQRKENTNEKVSVAYYCMRFVFASQYRASEKKLALDDTSRKKSVYYRESNQGHW